MLTALVLDMGADMVAQEQYGDGYTLTLATAVDRPVSRDAIHSLIAHRVPGATRVRAVGGELVYRLPLTHIARFPDLLEALEAEGMFCPPTMSPNYVVSRLHCPATLHNEQGPSVLAASVLTQEAKLGDAALLLPKAFGDEAHGRRSVRQQSPGPVALWLSLRAVYEVVLRVPCS